MDQTKLADDSAAKKNMAEAVPADTTAAATAAPTDKPADVVEDVPDPDEDDLDDLDDMLDEFSTVKLDSKQPATSTSQPAGGASVTAADAAAKEAPAAGGLPGAGADIAPEDFEKQLQSGMAELLGELEKSPEMQAEFENMFKQMAAAADQTGPEGDAAPKPAGAGEGAADAAGAAASDASFQDTIRKTMERMQNSGDQATAAATSGSADDFMSELLKQMSSGDMGGEGGEEDFSKMLMGMMEQLTNKEILYEPMKELNDKFPEWMEKNRAATSAEDLKRYDAQQELVGEIVAKFESSTYADSNAADREYIVERMQKMQEQGSPPSDLVGDMASAQEAFNSTDDQCNPQ